MTFKKTPHSTSLLNSARGARSRSPAPVPQEPSSNEAISAIIPASLLFPRGMLKGRDTVGYNPACLRVAVRPSSTSSCFPVRFSPLLSSSCAPVRCAAPSSLAVTVYRGRPVPSGGRKRMLTRRLYSAKWWRQKNGAVRRKGSFFFPFLSFYDTVAGPSPTHCLPHWDERILRVPSGSPRTGLVPPPRRSERTWCLTL